MTKRSSKGRTSKNPAMTKATVEAEVAKRIATANRALEEAEEFIGARQFEKAVQSLLHAAHTAGYASGMGRGANLKGIGMGRGGIYGDLADREEYVADLLVIALGQEPGPSDRPTWKLGT